MGQCLETINHAKYKLYMMLTNITLAVITITLAPPGNQNPTPEIMKFYRTELSVPFEYMYLFSLYFIALKMFF